MLCHSYFKVAIQMYGISFLNTRILNFVTFFAVILVLCSNNARAGDGRVEKLQSILEATKTFQASFVQESYNKDLDMTNTSSGKLYLRKKPAEVRWNYDKPDTLVFLITGDYFLYYSEEDNQVIKRKASGDIMLQTPLSLLTGEGKISEKYIIEKVKNGDSKTSFELRPKRDGENYKKLVLDVSGKEYTIKTITVIDENDNKTSVKFLNQLTNAPIKEGMFNFSIPKGAEVITDKDLPPAS